MLTNDRKGCGARNAHISFGGAWERFMDSHLDIGGGVAELWRRSLRQKKGLRTRGPSRGQGC